jgi:predicted dehydrogenase
MKFLIVGLGSIGRRHLRNLISLGERDIVLCRLHASSGDEESAAFPVETDLQAALTHRPDAVIISNPTALHLPVAIAAAQAGCAILIEKPLSHSLEGVDQLQAAVKQGGAPVLVGYQFRFHPGLQKVASLLKDGAIGRPLSVRAHWGEYLPGWHPWEDYRRGYSARADLGGGVVLTLSHPLDYLRWLVGEVQALWAFTGRLSDLQIDVEDTAEIGIRFDNGALGSLHLDYNQQPPSHHLEIIGAQGTLRWDNAGGGADGAADGAVALYRSSAQRWEYFPAPPGFERNHLFLDEMRHFLAVLRRMEQPACTLEDGLQALNLALAAIESAQTRQISGLKPDESPLKTWNV